MSDPDELRRDLDLIRSVADRSVMDIEAAGREATAEIQRQTGARQAQGAATQAEPFTPPPSDLDEDDYFQFQRYRR